MQRVFSNKFSIGKKIDSIDGYLSYIDFSSHPLHNVHMARLYPYGKVLVIPTIMNSIMSRPIILLEKDTIHSIQSRVNELLYSRYHPHHHNHYHPQYQYHPHHNYHPEFSSLFIL